MIWFILMYLYFVLNSLAFTMAFLGCIGAAVLTLGTCAYACDEPQPDWDSAWATMIPHIKRIIYIVAIPGILLCTFIPSKDEVAWIIGGGTAINLVVHEETQKLPNNVLQATNHFLESIKEEESGEE